MKKILSIILILSFAFTLVACGTKTVNDNDTGVVANSETNSDAE